MGSSYYPPPQGPLPQHGSYQPPPQSHNQNPQFNSIPLQDQRPPPVNYNQSPTYKNSSGGPGLGPNDPDEPPPPYTFEQQFALPKPKYNDLWAAILFIVDFFGLIVVSAISINAYRATKNTNGNGIYDGRENKFGVSSAIYLHTPSTPPLPPEKGKTGSN